MSQEDGGLTPAIACLHFLIDTLPPDQRTLLASCTDGAMLKRQVDGLVRFENSQRYSQYILRFITAVNPFFSAIDVISSVDPIHCATVWGGLRVIIQLIQKFTQFFDKFLASLNQLAEQFEHFKRVRDDTKDFKSCDGVKAVLEDIFEELVRYVTGVLHIFYRADGRAKNKALVLAKAAWKPFRFEDIVRRIEIHRQRLRDEIALQTLKESRGANTRQSQSSKYSHEDKLQSLFQQLELDSKHTLIDRLRRWLAPSRFKDRYDVAKRLRFPGTGEWIFANETYRSWNSPETAGEKCDRKPSAIWIRGKPGSGKTVIFGSIIDEMRAQNPGSAVLYYSFDSLEPSSASSCDAYRAVLAQIAQCRSHGQILMDLFSFAMYDGSDGQPTASLLEIKDLFSICVHLLSEVEMFLILDGLDECMDLESELVPELCELCNVLPIRLALLSRETVGYCVKEVPNLGIVNIGASNLEDIRLYLRHELGTLTQKKLLPEALHVDEKTDSLVHRADGMFLWARLLISYLNLRSLLPTDRLAAISEVDMPEGLEEMYQRIVTYIASQGKESVSLASYIFMWLIHARRELTLRELEEAVISRKRGGFKGGSQHSEGFSDIIITACGGLVEHHPNSQKGDLDSIPRLIHLSVREYLTEALSHNIPKSDVLQEFAILNSPLKVNDRLATLCVEYLTYSVPAESLCASFGSNQCRTNLELAFPLSNYAVTCWTYHLLATEGPKSAVKEEPVDRKSLMSALRVFLSQPKVLTAWIEACYIFDRPPPFRNLSEWAASKPQSSEPLEISEIAAEMDKFSRYLMKMINDWGLQLERDPSCAWTEVGAFTPSPFIVKTPGFNVKKLVSEVSLPTRLCHQPINKVSRLIASVRCDITLSVFPTRAFHECFAQAHRHSELFRDISYCRGWIARVEIFRIETGACIISMDLSIDPYEIMIQIYQTLLGGSIQFPLSISPDGRHFTVLRAFYSLVGEGSAMRCISNALLPLPLKQSTEKFWTLPATDDKGYKFDDYCRLRSRNDRDKVYLYWIYFHRLGNDLCLAEQVRSEPLTLKVFQLPKPSLQRRSQNPIFIARCDRWLRGWHNHQYQYQDRKDFELGFHPSLRIIALTGREATYLWNYTTGTRGELTKVGNGVGDGDMIKKLTFSADGTACILEMQDWHPVVINVSDYLPPMHMENEMLERLQRHEGIETPGTPNSNTIVPLPGSSSALQQFSSGGIIDTGTQVRTYGDKTIETSVTNRGGNAALSIKYRETHITVPLSRLPNWPGSAEAQPSVVLASEGNQSVKVVFDKPLQTWNEIEAPADVSSSAAFPLIVDKSLGLFPQLEGRSNAQAVHGIVESRNDSQREISLVPDSLATTARRQSRIPILRRRPLPK